MKLVDGFYYPDAEERLWRGHARFQDIEDEILPHCKNRRTCIQAGGAVGVWVQKFCEHFNLVVTAEPNHLQRECLWRNVSAENYHLLNCGFWNAETNGRIVEVQDNNLGAWRIEPDPDGDIHLVSIDGMGPWTDVDLICLDVEGAEVEALEGAKETIAEHRPIIVVETKWITQQAYKRTDEDLRKKVASFGYERRGKFGRDELWAPIG